MGMLVYVQEIRVMLDQSAPSDLGSDLEQDYVVGGISMLALAW